MHLPCAEHSCPDSPHGHSLWLQSAPKWPLAHRQVPLRQLPAAEQPPGQRAVSHAGPPQPSSQAQTSVPSAHVPWPEQSSGQPATEQASPRQPGSHSHAHVALECLPWTHGVPQKRLSQPAPPEPSGQKQLPLTQSPLPEQSSGQLFCEQSSPVHPSWQAHLPNTSSHTPFSKLVQPLGHALSSHARPK